jgi:RNase P subunit RPR2
MVRVVSAPETKQCTCNKCRCVLEYEFNDMKIEFASDYTGDRDLSATIKCPSCGNETHVNPIF